MWTSPRQLALLGLAVAGQVHAKPVKGISELECLAVDLVVLALDACTTATAFCSNYLSIPTITKTATVTTSLTTTQITSSTTGTNIITESTVTQTQTATATVTTCILSQAEDDSSSDSYKKRNVGPRPCRPATRKAIPTALSKFSQDEISTACSCLGIPTPTVTVTATATATKPTTSIINIAATSDVTATSVITITTTTTDIVCPTPSQCNNQGLQFALYPNNQGDSSDATYSIFDPTVYKTETPEFSGITSTAGGFDYSYVQEITVYGTSYEFESDYFVLDHRGYIFAAENGSYTISFTNVDDIVLLWLGANAYAGWTRADANAGIYFGEGGDGSASVDMVEGEYMPIRIMYAQAQGAAVFQVSITAPDGTVFLSSSTENSPYLVQYSCDLVSAPQFPAWGSET
ncbi:hypothetical protein SEUCBS139899_001269 [Sporothrix eucalyptigena]